MVIAGIVFTADLEQIWPRAVRATIWSHGESHQDLLPQWFP